MPLRGKASSLIPHGPSDNNVSHFSESHVPAVSNQKPTPKPRTHASTWKEKTACPECGQPISMHGLKYTQERVCNTTTKVKTQRTHLPRILKTRWVPTAPNWKRDRPFSDIPSVHKPCYLPEPSIIPTYEQIVAFFSTRKERES